MPRETIFPADADGFKVRVGWRPEQYVQIGMETMEGTLIDRLVGADVAPVAMELDRLVLAHLEDDGLPFDELPAVNRGLMIVEAVSTVAGHHSITSSIWANLDRDRCNELVRHVRRARNAAYGNDE